MSLLSMFNTNSYVDIDGNGENCTDRRAVLTLRLGCQLFWGRHSNSREDLAKGSSLSILRSLPALGNKSYMAHGPIWNTHQQFAALTPHESTIFSMKWASVNQMHGRYVRYGHYWPAIVPSAPSLRTSYGVINSGSWCAPKMSAIRINTPRLALPFLCGLASASLLWNSTIFSSLVFQTINSCNLISVLTMRAKWTTLARNESIVEQSVCWSFCMIW